MTWSYSGDPSSSTTDEVRFLVGDTDTTDQLVSNEEIDYAVAETSNAFYAAALVAKSIAGLFARKVTKAVGDLRIEFSDRHKHYLSLAEQLEDLGSNGKASSSGLQPYAGGISVSDKDAVESNSDRVEPHFKVGIHNNPTSRSDDDDDTDC